MSKMYGGADYPEPKTLPLTAKVLFYKAFGWIVFRPVRWFFQKMIAASYPNFRFSRWDYDGSIRWPNAHWWLLYKTVFKFFKWLHYDAWRHLATWKNGRLYKKPWYAQFIHWLGAVTAGTVIFGGRCNHCGSSKGDPVELSDSDEYFELMDKWSVGTLDGTDHRSFGYTHCPCCHHIEVYEDGSL